jgi:5-methylcytosine-specific restriction endonuclease McrBC GTP-binding regulatory subunit McrB
MKIVYKEYEKKVYNWLKTKNEQDPSFTFSLRQNGSKGAELDYFIGTEKSRYFAVTFWTLPVGFPGSSGDCMGLIFKLSADYKTYSYDFKLTQTNSPHDEQNTSALNLIKSLTESIEEYIGAKRISADDNKMFTIRSKPRHESYKDLTQMLEDVGKDLSKLIPIVNTKIEEEKKVNPEFEAHRITKEEFANMQVKLLVRFDKYREQNSNSMEIRFEDFLKNLLSEGTVKTYLLAIRSIEKLAIKEGFNLISIYDFVSSVDFRKFWNKLKDNKTFENTNVRHHNRFSSALLKYDEFLKFKKVESIHPESEYVTSLNQILYGPPGTGKTYKTKELAVQISNPNFIYDINWSIVERREEIVKEYDRLCEKGQIVFTTFHQSMSYEDFVEGIKPKTENEKVTYEVEDGIFKEISLKASQKTISNFKDAYNQLLKEFSDNDNDFLILKTPKEKEFRIKLNSNNNLSLFTTNKSSQQGTFTKEKLEQHLYYENAFNGWEGYANAILNYLKDKFKLSNKGINHRNYTLIIDEINRGNVSAIFGELITLLEDDKRIGQKEAIKITLPYSKVEFGVPSNLYIIGTMNTADRSVEAIDTALRRRFSFTEVAPNSGLLKGKKVEEIELKTLLQTINDRIELLIDKDHKIGHSYFLNIETLEDLKQTFKNKVVPLLEEYFFGDYGKIGLVLGDDFIKLKDDEDKISFAKNFTKKYENAENLREKAVYTFTNDDSWVASSFTSIYEQ